MADMSDIVERLERYADQFEGEEGDLMREGAAEIDRLRAALAAGPTSEKLSEALKATDYKYFGDYPLSEGQWDAVGVLCAAARTLLNAKDDADIRSRETTVKAE